MVTNGRSSHLSMTLCFCCCSIDSTALVQFVRPIASILSQNCFFHLSVRRLTGPYQMTPSVDRTSPWTGGAWSSASWDPDAIWPSWSSQCQETWDPDSYGGEETWEIKRQETWLGEHEVVVDQLVYQIPPGYSNKSWAKHERDQPYVTTVTTGSTGSQPRHWCRLCEKFCECDSHCWGQQHLKHVIERTEMYMNRGLWKVPKMPENLKNVPECPNHHRHRRRRHRHRH